jgi:hypothetical protein
MTHFWKWLGLAACGVGLLVATDRMRVVTASEEGAAYDRGGDLGAKVDRLADKLDQLLGRIDGRMGRGEPPHGDHAGPPRGGREHGPMHGGRPEWGGPSGGPRGGMPPEMRERLEQARGAMQERMEKARERFQELEERVKTLEAEVKRLRASQQG